jgi:hypothetical protein
MMFIIRNWHQPRCWRYEYVKLTSTSLLCKQGNFTLIFIPCHDVSLGDIHSRKMYETEPPVLNTVIQGSKCI